MENYKSVNSYAKKLSVDSSSLVFAKDSLSFVLLNRAFRGSPDMLVFNKEKKFLPYKSDSVSCNAPIVFFLKNICDMESMHAPITREINYTEFLSALDDHNNVLQVLNDTTIDFTVFINFDKYTPKLSREHIIPWNKAFKDHAGTCNVKLVYVDMDYLESWGMSKKSLPRLRVAAN